MCPVADAPTMLIVKPNGYSLISTVYCFSDVGNCCLLVTTDFLLQLYGLMHTCMMISGLFSPSDKHVSSEMSRPKGVCACIRAPRSNNFVDRTLSPGDYDSLTC